MMSETTGDLETKDWYADEHATFGDRLAAARENAGLSQKEFGRRLGVKVKTVVGWENDISEPRANRLQMMAGLLNVSLMWLLNGAGEGIDPPGTEPSLDHGERQLLLELRELRGDIDDASIRIARIEKRLREALGSKSA
jgi:HTH-type transcriptional regulator, cell division transcriptional repressor